MKVLGSAFSYPMGSLVSSRVYLPSISPLNTLGFSLLVFQVTEPPTSSVSAPMIPVTIGFSEASSNVSFISAPMVKPSGLVLPDAPNSFERVISET